MFRSMMLWWPQLIKRLKGFFYAIFKKIPRCQPSRGSPSREVVKKVKFKKCHFENSFEDLVINITFSLFFLEIPLVLI